MPRRDVAAPGSTARAPVRDRFPLLAGAIRSGATLADLVEAYTERGPSAPAVIDGGIVRSWRELRDDVLAAARSLCGQGLRSSDAVGVTVADHYRNLAVTLALTRVGCAQTTLPDFEPEPARVDLAARLGLTARIVDDGGGPGRVARVAVPAGATAGTPRPEPLCPPGTLVFTSSGTTGRAKLIPLSPHRFLVSAAQYPDPPETFYALASNQHNAPRRQLWRVLARGGTVILGNNWPTLPLREACERYGATHVLATGLGALALSAGEDSADGPVAPAINVFLSGSRIGAALRARVRERVSPKTSVVYGAMECMPITRADPDQLDSHPDTIGTTMPEVTVELVDDGHRPVPPGEIGAIRVRSPSATDGYLDDDTASRRAFRDGWFYPGDLARALPDGAYAHCGRSDDMMILDSINVFPAEIEAVAESWPGVIDCAAFARRSPVHGDIPMLAVVADRTIDRAALLLHCRERLGLRAPRGLVVVPALPRNASGKVLRRALAGGT